jgi:nitrate reductase molybdenum cofactor assembly chaperone
MSHIPKVLDAFARLLTYPDQHTGQAAELLYIILAGEIDEAARAVAEFGGFLEQHENWEVEEAFTGTFDVNPTCALEVGWHLFGEEYARGLFLVRMREEMRKYELGESTELPDHISHVLAIVASMPEDKAAKFVTACVQPAVEKMNEALSDKDTPYRHVMAALASVMEQKWGECKSIDQHGVLASRGDMDPLHAFPVADVGCGSGKSCGEPDVVTLRIPSGNARLHDESRG